MRANSRSKNILWPAILRAYTWDKIKSQFSMGHRIARSSLNPQLGKYKKSWSTRWKGKFHTFNQVIAMWRLIAVFFCIITRKLETDCHLSMGTNAWTLRTIAVSHSQLSHNTTSSTNRIHIMQSGFCRNWSKLPIFLLSIVISYFIVFQCGTLSLEKCWLQQLALK